ncbi:MAG: NAD(P)H-dependent dehydrogenase/reductase [Firmicutes bacterium]|nr:NAD(P)H-dependent dehydrogenase/reductase [Bacillota bacterium]
MDFWQLIAGRRSIRKYKSDPVEPEKVAKILEAALRAPSSRNIKPWEFIVVTEPGLIAKLAQARKHNAFLKEAPLAIVVCADPEKCDVWVEDAAIAATFISLAATALGLGHCWLQIRRRDHSAEQTAEEYVRAVLQIPSHLKVEAIMAIGYPAEEKAGHPRAGLAFDKLHQNIYGQRFGDEQSRGDLHPDHP